jgi:hypothetical protein
MKTTSLIQVGVALAALSVLGCGQEGDRASSTPIVAPTPPPPPPPPPTHKIVLHRPSKVGDIFHETTTVDKQESSVMKIGEQTKTKNESRHLELAAKVKILAVDALGQPTSTEYTIERFVAGQAPEQEVVIEPGRVLTVTRGDEPTLELDRGRLSKQAKQDVEALLNTGEVKSITDDQVFGTKVPQPVGAAWPIDSAAAAEALSEDKLRILPEGLSGTAKLLAVREEAGGECLELAAHFEVKGIEFLGMPRGTVVEQSEMTVDQSGLFPRDHTKQRLRDTMKLTGQFRLKMTLLGKTVSMDMSLSETKQRQRTPLQ